MHAFVYTSSRASCQYKGYNPTVYTGTRIPLVRLSVWIFFFFILHFQYYFKVRTNNKQSWKSYTPRQGTAREMVPTRVVSHWLGSTHTLSPHTTNFRRDRERETSKQPQRQNEKKKKLKFFQVLYFLRFRNCIRTLRNHGYRINCSIWKSFPKGL